MLKYVIFLVILFSGCATKINPKEFTKIPIPKSPFAPKKISKPQILIYKISNLTQEKYLSSLLKSHLQTQLSLKNIVLLTRKPLSLKKEIILYQKSLVDNINLNQADFLINASILDTTYSYKYHPPIYWKDKKGKIHYIPTYYSYKASVKEDIKILQLPNLNIYSTKNFYNCEYSTSKIYQNLKNTLLKKAILNNSLKRYFFNTFAPKGYIYEVRKKDNKLIAKTTLTSNDGIKEGMKVYIYTKEKVKNPFKEEIKEIKIGEGEINIVTQKYSWILINKISQKIKLGDYVKVYKEKSFWDFIIGE